MMETMDRILLVDSDREERLKLAGLLRQYDFAVVEAADGQEALSLFAEIDFAAALLDLTGPDTDGFVMLGQIKRISSSVPIILITGMGDIQNAISAIKLGAYDYFVKPLRLDRLALTLRQAIDRFKLEGAYRRVVSILDAHLAQSFGKSSAMQYVTEQIVPAATGNNMVIIQGESGSGKNFLARLLHNMSDRSERSFVCINLDTIPEPLIGKELFGFGKEAFAGTEQRVKGLLETACGGTLIINELQNMSPLIQEMLLKVINEKKFYPIGSDRPVAADIRFISCVSTDIRKAVSEGRFREDLYFLLGESIIFLPPLRERREDIPLLASRFFMEAAEELNKPVREISKDALDMLLRHDWPGNVRELRDAVRRAVLAADDGIIKAADISLERDNQMGTSAEQPIPPLKELSALAAKEAEAKALKQIMIQTKGNKTLAARLLKVDYKTLLKKIKYHNITG
jgi:DNA-binding NtrC family response regulator